MKTPNGSSTRIFIGVNPIKSSEGKSRQDGGQRRRPVSTIEMLSIVLTGLFFFPPLFYKDGVTTGATRFAGAVEVN